MKAGSVGFVERAAEHVGLFFVAKKAEAQRFIFCARASSPRPLLTGEGLCHVEDQGAPEDTQNWFVGSADIKNACAFWDGYKRFLHSPLFSHPKLFTLEERSKKRLAPGSLLYIVPTTFPMIFRG